MPQGGFSPLRLEGWRIRRDLPGTSFSLSLLPAYAVRRPVCLRPSCFSVDPPKVGSVDAMYCTATRWNAPPTPGALAPVRVMLSRPSSLNRPHPPCSRAHRNFTARRLMRPTGCPSSPMPSTMPTPGTSTSRPPPMRSRSSSPPSGNERAGCLRPGAAPRAPVEQVSMRSSPRPGDLPPHGRCAEPRPAGTPAPWGGPRAPPGGREGDLVETGGFMLAYAAKRLSVALLVALTVSLITFSMIYMSGDPAIAIAGEGARAEDVEAIRKFYGFDRPIAVQYLDWLAGALTGDLGRSYTLRQPVAVLIRARLPVTMILGAAAIAFALVLAIPLGVVAAVRPNSMVDRFALALAVVGQAMPSFWFALTLILWLGVHWRLLP